MADFKGKKVIVAAGATANYIVYEGIKYLKQISGSGTVSWYKYKNTGSNLDDVATANETPKNAEEYIMSEEHFIQDNTGAKYFQVFVPYYTIAEENGTGKPTLVGRQPSGNFGGKP